MKTDWKHTTSQNTLKSRDRWQTDHGQTELNNVLVKKNVLNEINKDKVFIQGFKDCSKIKEKVSQNLDANLEKAWLLYEFPFGLNLGDKPNDSQTWKNYSSLSPVSQEDQFQANSEEYWWNSLGAAK